MYYASIFAKLETPDRRDDWLLEHGVGQSIPNGGPVFSYSCDDESKHRDLTTELADALELAAKRFQLLGDIKINGVSTEVGYNEAMEVLKKIGR